MGHQEWRFIREVGNMEEEMELGKINRVFRVIANVSHVMRSSDVHCSKGRRTVLTGFVGIVGLERVEELVRDAVVQRGHGGKGDERRRSHCKRRM